MGERVATELKKQLKSAGVGVGRELGNAIAKGVRQVAVDGLSGLESDIQRFGGRMRQQIESSLGSSGEGAGREMGEVAGRAAGRALEQGLSRAAPELGALGARLGQNLADEFGALGSRAGRLFADKVVSVSANIVSAGFSASTGALRNFVSGFRDGEQAADSLDSRVARMGASVRGSLDGLAERARATGVQLYDALGEPVVRAGQRIGQTLSATASSVGQTLAPITQPIRRAMSSVVDSVAPADGALRRFASAAGERFTTLGGRVRSSMGTAFGKVREAAGRAASAVKTSVGNALKTLGSQVQSSLAQIGIGDLGQALSASWGRLDAVDRLRDALRGVTTDGRETTQTLDAVLGVAGSTSFDSVAWADAARQLVNMGVAADQLAPTMAAVGDIAAAGGKITQDSLGNVIGVFRDMQSTGELTAESLSRFGDAAGPIRDRLKDAFEKDTIEELSQAMRDGEITAEQVMATIVDEVGTGMDGVSGSMADARGTWEGTMNRLKGVVTGALATVLEPVKPKIEAGVEWIGQKLEQLPEFMDRVVAFVRDSGIDEAFMSALGAVRDGLGSLMKALESWGPKIRSFFAFVSENRTAFGALAAAITVGVVAFKAVTAATALWNAVMAMNPIGLVVVALAALVAGLIYAYNNSETFREVVDAVFTFIKGAAEDVMAFFTETLPGMWDVLKEKAQAFWDGLVGLIETAWEWIKAIIAHHPFVILFTYWDEIKAFIGEAWTWLVERTTEVWDWLLEKITAVAQGIADFLTAVWETITTAVQTAWTWITELISTAWNTILELVGSAVQWVVDLVTGFHERVVAIFTAVRERAQEIFAAIRDRIVAIVIGLRDQAVGIVTAIRDRIVSAFTGAKDRAVQAFVTMRDNVRDKISGLMETVTGIPGKVKEAFSNAKDFLVQAGKNIIQGLIDGVSNMIGNLRDKFSSVTGLIPDWKGPRRVDRRLLTPAGRLIMDGLMGGIDDRVPDLRGQLGGVTDQISRSVVPPSLEVRRHSAAMAERERPPIQIVNNYPQAEPTSTTVNRSLQYAASIGVI
ncbi:tape measure protein [Nocardiopsis sp. Huas11]|uniref:tape measure protein n=1 Tax=Nocardiopsis sp. Huas11 TaxID=2183912 RepID=UPI0011C442AD|nr:tape measure protein [Nocardiopsis sp. Huas11]